MRHGKVSLGGIRYSVQVHEGLVTFAESDGMTAARLEITKSEAPGLLYLKASSWHDGRVPACHVANAVAVAETILGPNHWPTIEAGLKGERGIAIEYLFRRPTFGVRHKLFWQMEVLWRITRLATIAKTTWRLWRPVKRPVVTWLAGTTPTPEGGDAAER